MTATTLSSATVRFVKRDDFLQLLRASPAGGLNAVLALSHEYAETFERLRSIALLHTAGSRIAQLLLKEAANSRTDALGSNIRFLLTQEQIAQMTCTTRETVTRFFGQLKRDGVIALRGSNLVIVDRMALEKMAS